MRLQGDEAAAFQQTLLDIGEGRIISHNQVPQDLFMPRNQNVDDLIDYVYPGNPTDHAENMILCLTNRDANNINTTIVDRCEGDLREYQSVDQALDVDNDAFPTEFLNSLELPGLPHHCLRLKVGMPVILLRNLNASEGLCNGTRMKVVEMANSVVTCEILAGRFAGNRVFIPRIICDSNRSTLPFVLRRLQFPLALNFAMTINKSQGQSLNRVGIYLDSPIFSHGQLYVALSRCRNPDGIKIFATRREYLKNIVYNEVL